MADESNRKPVPPLRGASATPTSPPSDTPPSYAEWVDSQRRAEQMFANYTAAPIRVPVDAKTASQGPVIDVECEEPVPSNAMSLETRRYDGSGAIEAKVETAIDRPIPIVTPQPSNGFGWGTTVVIAALAGAAGYAIGQSGKASPAEKPQSKKRRGNH